MSEKFRLKPSSILLLIGPYLFVILGLVGGIYVVFIEPTSLAAALGVVCCIAGAIGSYQADIELL